MADLFCTEASQSTEFKINVILHIFILFTLLTTFYLTYISKVETDALNNELDSLINNGIGPNVKSLPDNLKWVLKNTPIEQIQKLYKNEDPVKQLNNKWVSKSMIAMSIALITALILIVYALKSGCNQCIDWQSLIIENLVTFMFVGMVEAAFFVFIAFRFLPVEPSYMTEKLKQDFLQIFS